MTRRVWVDDLDIDEPRKQRVTECLESSKKLARHAPKYSNEQVEKAHELAGVDENATLVLNEPKPEAGSARDLKGEYSIDDLQDARLCAAEIDRLQMRVSAMEDRCPEHVESRLKPRLAALRRIQDEIDAPVASWIVLAEELGADNMVETLANSGAGADSGSDIEVL